LPTGARDFSVLYTVQTSFEAHPDSYTMDKGGSFPEGKAARGLKLTVHFHLMQRSKMMELYVHSPIRFYGILLD
jgi:hypothetical protein